MTDPRDPNRHDTGSSMEAVDHYLSRMLVKDEAKGGTGWRSIQDVARVCAPHFPKMPWAAEALFAAVREGRVEMTGSGPDMMFRTTLTLAEAKERHPEYIP